MTERTFVELGRQSLLLALLACAPLAAEAAGLGEAVLRSGLSQPLRVEIPLVGEDLDALGPECFRLQTQTGTSDDLPWVRDAQMLVERDSDRHRLIVTTRHAIHDPAIMLGVLVGCGAQVRREYALLLGPAAAIEAPRTAPGPSAASPTQRPRASNTAVQTWTAAEGESAASIAAALLPRDRAAQRRAARDIVRANPALYAGQPDATNLPLPAGSELHVPMPAATRAAPAVAATEAVPPAAVRAPASKPPREPSKPATPATPKSRSDRLTVTADDGEAQLKESAELEASRRQTVPDEATRDRLRREQQLILSIDDRIATTIELNERIRQLEAAQKRLLADNDRLAKLISQQTPGKLAIPAVTTTPPIDWRPVLLAAAALLLAIGGGVAWRRRRIRVMPVEPLPGKHDDGLAALEDEGDFEAEALTSADIWPDRGGAPASGDTTRADIDWSPPTLSPAALGPSSLLHIDDEVEEHDSAVELAEIMMSFGRVQGAAETLAEFIRANPKQAVRPWIKLLEVYKAASMRMEFDALADQLNKTFNVRAVTWDEFEEVKAANESVEQMGHIIARIRDSWGSRDCQLYLHTLLRDNRKGTRQGFPLGIVDDILCLNGVLEIQLGAFKPTPAEMQEMESPTPRDSSGMIADIAPQTQSAAFVPTTAALPAPPSAPTPFEPVFAPTQTESMIEFNLDEDLPPLKPRDR